MDTQVTALQAGDIDMIVQFDVLAGEQLFDDELDQRAGVAIGGDTGRCGSKPLTRSSQFTNRNLRRAMAYAVDRNQLDPGPLPGSGDARERSSGAPLAGVLRRRRRAAARKGHRDG